MSLQGEDTWAQMRTQGRNPLGHGGRGQDDASVGQGKLQMTDSYWEPGGASSRQQPCPRLGLGFWAWSRCSCEGQNQACQPEAGIWTCPCRRGQAGKLGRASQPPLGSLFSSATSAPCSHCLLQLCKERMRMPLRP